MSMYTHPDTIQAISELAERLGVSEPYEIPAAVESLIATNDRLTAELEQYRWIGVEDALPEICVPVLVWNIFGETITVPVGGDAHIAFLRADGLWQGHSTGWNAHYITHWQPLPLPPAKTGEKGEGACA